MLKIGVFGVGHLGRIHVKCIGLSDLFELVGFYDPDDASAQKCIAEYGLQRFDTPEALLEKVDLIDIVTPTLYHFNMAKLALSMGKHVFIEKPVTHTVEEADQLLAMQAKTGLKVQVGHVERFNPAFLSLKENHQLQPGFIEAHRLAPFNPRGTDVSVILDLMIHDIDIVLHLVDSPVKHLSASGVAVLSDTPDIANARIEFENGCVANLTASRMSLKAMRKVRLFQKDAYISLDFLEKNAQIVQLFGENEIDAERKENAFELELPNETKFISIDMPESKAVNAIQMELETFHDSIVNDTRPIVNLQDGVNALKLAHAIINDIQGRILN